jgi:hypothetical protein
MRPELIEKLRSEISNSIHTYEKFDKVLNQEDNDEIVQIIRNVVIAFHAKRQYLINKFAIPTVERLFTQHFLQKSDKPNAPLTQIQKHECIECKINNNLFYEPFPPKFMFETFVELIILLLYDYDDINDLQKYIDANSQASIKLHLWLKEIPELRCNFLL